jgi:hypothetical protein
MRPLSSSDFLDLWERGGYLHPLDQGLLALGAALPQTSYENLADWPLGRRNRALAELRYRCFGSRLQGWTACARCGEKLEFELDGRTLAAETADAERSLSEPIVVKGHFFRLPTSRDMASVAQETDSHSAAIRLMEGCSVDAAESVAWSEEDLEEVGERMAQADPMAEILLTLRCPVCDNEWSAALDIATFLWAEIEARAKRILFEVHALASAYGWTEKEVLSLSEHRRALYMGMVQE